MIVTVVAGSQIFGLPLCVVNHLRMWLCIPSPLRQWSAASCSCFCLCCYSSVDVCRSAHHLTEDRCNLEQTQGQRSQTAPGKVQRREWVQVEAILLLNIVILDCGTSKINIFLWKYTCKNVSILSCIQDSVRIRTEEGSSLLINPEKHYSEDFEPHESVDMEVEWRHDNAY